MAEGLTPTEEALLAWGRVWSGAAEKICLLALLSIAQVSHDQGVTQLTLGWSDQGDWLSIDAVMGEGDDFDEETAYDTIIDESFAVGDLRGEWQETWAAHVTAGEKGESFTLDVTQVLSELSLDEIGVPS